MAKLIDILARELKEWPEQYERLSQMRHDGGIINGRGFDGVIAELNRMVATASIIDKSWARKVCSELYDAGYRKQK